MLNQTDPLLRAKEVAEILQVSVPTLYRRMADGSLPRPVKLGGISRWPRSEIVAAIEAAKAGRAA